MQIHRRQTSLFAAFLAAALFGAALLGGAPLAPAHPGDHAAPLPLPEAKLDLTDQERAYLRDKAQLTLVGDPNWPPYDFVDADGNHRGIAADYYRVIAHLVGVPIWLVPTRTWTESLETALLGECDLMSMLNKNAERSRFLDFTNTFYSSHVTLVGRAGTTAPGGLGGLRHEEVSLVKNYWITGRLARDYPHLNKIFSSTTADALKLVQMGGAMVAVTTEAEATWLLSRPELSDLEIIGGTRCYSQLRIGVRKGDATLLRIMQKALDAIPDETHRDIRARWVHSAKTHDHSFGLQHALIGVGLALAAFAVFGWLRLRRK